MTWAEIEKTLHDAVVAGSGITGAKVVWAKQGGPRLPRPFVTLRRTGGTEIGSTVARKKTYNGAADPGEEVETRSRRQLKFTLSIQVFALTTIGDAGASALLDAIQGQFRKRTQLDALRAGGVALEDSGAPQELGAVLQTLFEGRAALDMVFRVASETLEATGFIETVNVATTATL